MTGRDADDDEWNDDDDDWKPDEDDISEDEDEDEPTIACPFCKRQIHEDSQRCPHCENYISDEDAPPARKPWWMIAGVLLCLYVLY